MALEMLSGPAGEPVSLAETKVYLRVDHFDEDALIASLITTARLQVEAGLGLALIDQQWMMQADCWPLSGVVEVPLRPLQSVDEIRVLDADGAATIVDSISYAVDATSAPPRIASRTGFWPRPGARLAGIEIDLTVGFGADAADVPDDLRQALLALVAHWYEHRGPAEQGSASPAIPNSVSRLLSPYKAVRL